MTEDKIQDSVLKIVKHWSEISRISEGLKSYWTGDSADAHNRIYEDVKRDMDEVLFGTSDNAGQSPVRHPDGEDSLPEVF